MRRVALVLVLCLSSATATLAAEPTPLTAADLRYLETLGYRQADLTAKKPTPEALERLRQAINDPATAGKPKARSDAVYRQLDSIEARFIWCEDNPTHKDCGLQKTATAP